MKAHILVSTLLAAGASSVAFADWKEDQKNADQECLKLLSVSQIDPIRKKIPMTNPIENTTFEMTVNTNRLPVTERPALVRWVEAKQECFRLYDKVAESNRLYRTTRLNSEFRSGFESLAVDLYQRKISLGDFNKKYKEMSVQYKSALEADFARARQQAQQQVQQQQLQAEQAQAAQSAEDNRRFERDLEMLRLLAPRRTRENTDCSWGKDTLNCTTTR